MSKMCPACSWEPSASSVWTCHRCTINYHVFNTRGICPGCRRSLDRVACPACGQISGYDLWAGQDARTPLPRPFKPQL